MMKCSSRDFSPRMCCSCICTIGEGDPLSSGRVSYEIISTSFAESAINEVVSRRMVKKQQMRWTKKGAHLLLQVRVKTLNDELRSKFEDWHPGLKNEVQNTAEMPLAV